MYDHARYSDFIVNEVDRENQAVHLTNYDLPQPDPENIKIRDQRIQEKEEKAQANMEMSDEDKLAELAAVLENDEETMAQVKKMLDSYGNDVEFVNLKVDMPCPFVALPQWFTLCANVLRTKLLLWNPNDLNSDFVVK